MCDKQTLGYHISSSCQNYNGKAENWTRDEFAKRDSTFQQMPAVSTGSSALKSPLRYARHVNRGILLQSKRLDQSPQTPDDTRNKELQGN